jgi:hypothetical protein
MSEEQSTTLEGATRQAHDHLADARTPWWVDPVSRRDSTRRRAAVRRPAVEIVSGPGSDGAGRLLEGTDGCPPRVPDQGPQLLDERQRIFDLLKLEIGTGAALARRTVTLFALLAAGVAVLLVFAGTTWLSPSKSGSAGLSHDELLWAKGMLLAAIACVVLAAVLGCLVVLRGSRWRAEVRTLIAMHLIGAWAGAHSRVLLEAADRQRLDNERGARWARRQAYAAALGLLLVVVNVVFVVCTIDS